MGNANELFCTLHSGYILDTTLTKIPSDDRVETLDKQITDGTINDNSRKINEKGKFLIKPRLERGINTAYMLADKHVRPNACTNFKM